MLFPDPVGPVTSTNPRGNKDNFLKISGVFNSSNVKIVDGIVRNTAAAPRFFSTWHADFAEVTMNSIRAEVAGLAAHGYDKVLNGFQVDDGYEPPNRSRKS